jgi:septum formation protein
MLDHLKKYRIVLGSKSPRRRELLAGILNDFEIMVKDTDEHFPSHLKKQEIPVYLSKQKATAFEKEITEKNILLLTCDTIVWINDHALNKPENKEEAVKMLLELSVKNTRYLQELRLRRPKNKLPFLRVRKLFLSHYQVKKLNFTLKHITPLIKPVRMAYRNGWDMLA